MNLLLIIQIIVALLVIVTIVIQNQGSGLGSAWGGSSETYHTKRGVEKALFTLTIILVIAFTGISILSLLYR